MVLPPRTHGQRQNRVVGYVRVLESNVDLSYEDLRPLRKV